MASVLTGKYCNYTGFLTVEAQSNCSHGWRGMLIVRDLIKKHIGWAIGNGCSTHIWQDNWLSTSTALCPSGPTTEHNELNLVVDLMLEQSREWDKEKIDSILPQLWSTISVIKPSKKGGEDKRICLNNPSGNYSARTGHFASLAEKQDPNRGGPTVDHQWIKEV